MLRNFRRRLQAYVALAVFTSGLALPYVATSHLAFDDDAACGGAAFSGSGTPEFQAPGPVRVAGHCAICHWLRTAGGARTAFAASGDTWFQPAELVVISSDQWLAGVDVTDRPSRAPPVRLYL